MNFKSSDQLIARVVKTLNSYQSSGLLDEGDFYRWIKEVITLLNVPSFSPVHKIVRLDGDKFPIPEDMHQLWSIFRYEEECRPAKVEKHLQGHTRWLVEEEQCNKEVCVDKCDSYHEEGDLMIKRWYIEENVQEQRFINKQPVRIVNYTVDRCLSSSPCRTVKSPLKANIDKNYFYFNFSDGLIYLQYYTVMVDEDGLPMIPDVTEIELAIEKYIIYRFFQELYYNTTGDVLQRMQVAEAAYYRAMDTAKLYCKFPTYQELVDIMRRKKGSLKMYELRPVR